MPNQTLPPPKEKVTEKVEEVSKLKSEVSELDVEKNSKQASTSVEAEVKKYFSDIPELVEVAKCESHFRHTNEDGNIHRGVVNSADVGVMQINEDYHLKESLRLGFDIYTLKGNMGYARYLYDKQGLKPWVYSGKCWQTAVNEIKLAQAN